jgi:hypothetical protein
VVESAPAEFDEFYAYLRWLLVDFLFTTEPPRFVARRRDLTPDAIEADHPCFSAGRDLPAAHAAS